MLHYYPSISEDQFESGCKALEEKCHDNLNGTNWLSVRWHDGELEVKQASAKTGTTLEDLPICSREDGKNSIDAYEGKADFIEDDDEHTFARNTSNLEQSDRPAVDFSILLSPTYRVPILWFTLSSNKAAQIRDLEEIYSRVVTPGSHHSLRGIGIMGGISLSNHPITDKPAFFVHPCNTPEAMSALNDGSRLDPLQYLLLWFGIVGAGVGLHVPSKVASS